MGGFFIIINIADALPAQVKKPFFSILIFFHLKTRSYVAYTITIAVSLITCPYVPISQEDRYFFCSSVKISILIPIESNLRRATFWSISNGTV